MDDIPIGALYGALIFLIFVSAFFSAAEIGMLTMNRYRLRHMAESGHRSARMVQRLLARPDRLLGVILLGNNLANIAASSVATILALELYGEPAIAVAAFLLTLLVLIFAEVAPKTLAAMNPERVAFPAAYILLPLLTLLYPVVWMVNFFANLTLRLFGVSVHGSRAAKVTSEELRAVVIEAGALMPESHQNMLLAILDLEKITVEDVMVDDPYVVDIETSLITVLDELADRHIGTALVTKDGRLAGIFSTGDACRELAERLKAEFGDPSGGTDAA